MYRQYYSIKYFVKKIIQYFAVAIRGDEKEFTTGSINKAIYLLAVPMVLEMALESLFAVVDIFFVSKISINAVATVGLTESVLTIIYSISFGLSMGVTAMVARRVGEKNPDKAAHVAGQAIILALMVSLITGITGFLFAADILRMLGGSESLISEGVGFTRIMFAGNIVIMLIFLINGVFRGAGDAAIAMRVLWISNGLNIILDPLLIFGIGPFPELGIKGAAIATNIGRGVGVVYQLYHLFNGKAIVTLAMHHFKIHLETVKRLSEISLGAMGQFLIESASWIFLMRIMATFGSEALAGYTIAFRIIVFTILPTFGLSNAAATLVGQNLGAGHPERAERSVWLTSFYAMVFLGVISVVFGLSAKPLIAIFNSNPLVMGHGILSLRVICLGYLFFAYGMVISQALNGAGDTKTPTIINVFCFWLIQIPLAYLLAVSLKMGPAGVVSAITLCFSIHALVCIYVFRLGLWKKVKV
jgi:putative MATE family efflux protein